MNFKRPARNQQNVLRRTLNHNPLQSNFIKASSSTFRLQTQDNNSHMDPEQSSPFSKKCNINDSPTRNLRNALKLKEILKQPNSQHKGVFFERKQIKLEESRYSNQQQIRLNGNIEKKEPNQISLVQIYGMKGFQSLSQNSIDDKQEEKNLLNSKYSQKQNQYILIEKTRYQTLKNKIDYLQKQNMKLIIQNKQLRQSHIQNIPINPQTPKPIPKFLQDRTFNKQNQKHINFQKFTNLENCEEELRQCVEKVKKDLKDYQSYKYQSRKCSDKQNEKNQRQSKGFQNQFSCKQIYTHRN